MEMEKKEVGGNNSGQDEVSLLGGEYEIVKTQKSGTLFIEARIRDDVEEEVDIAAIQKDLECQLSRNQIFNLFADLMANEYDARLLLGHLYNRTRHIQSLKVVEYSGPATEIESYCSDNLHIKVQVYRLYHTPRSREEHEDLPQVDITPLPHIRFDGQWDELFFEQDIQGDLIWMMTNILRFSQVSNREPGDTSPLILLTGPPGTGKTTLCQGLAQKISIRLNSVYKRTSLIQIKAAALLSKYYSESAKQVDKIFTGLQQRCEDDPEEFICVLIDEVETIAVTREASAHGESQESLRATNAFLTGLDRTRSYPNIVFLCTSNMVDSLDAAFLDRCGLKVAVDFPSLASQYAILRGRIQKLISRKIVLSETVLPAYRDAAMDRMVDPELPGPKILHVLDLINSTTSDSSEGSVTGRSLTQLPEQALLRYLRGEDCDLDMALELIVQHVKAGQASTKHAATKEGNRKSEGILARANNILENQSADANRADKAMKGPGAIGRKRNAGTACAEDHCIDRALLALEECSHVMGGLVAELRRREGGGGHVFSE